MAVAQGVSITLSWLNSLGGWEYFTFTQNKTWGYNSVSESQLERSGFTDWDTDFISGDTILEELRIKASETLTIRSQDVSDGQVAALARLRFSLKVYDYTDSYKPVAILLNKGSFQYYTDRDKRNVIEFQATYPPIYIQTG